MALHRSSCLLYAYTSLNAVRLRLSRSLRSHPVADRDQRVTAARHVHQPRDGAPLGVPVRDRRIELVRVRGSLASLFVSVCLS